MDRRRRPAVDAIFERQYRAGGNLTLRSFECLAIVARTRAAICKVSMTPFGIVPMSPGDRLVLSVSRCIVWRVGSLATYQRRPRPRRRGRGSVVTRAGAGDGCAVLERMRRAINDGRKHRCNGNAAKTRKR